jgi:hypothetical protein
MERPDKLEDVTARLCDHIASVYQENSPERIYFLMLYNIFKEFLEDVNEDVLPNDRTGYQDSLIWQKLFNFQRDAATGLINKLETYNGCILADSVGLGKTFTALAVVKYYELRNKSVLVLCPKKLADNWLNYNRNLKTNLFAKDRFNYDVLCHTDLSRTSGESLRHSAGPRQLGQLRPGRHRRVAQLPQQRRLQGRETRYQKLMNQVIRQGVKTKVLMLSATPVNNRFNDLRNQLALAYEGDSDNLSKKLRTASRTSTRSSAAPRRPSTLVHLPPEQRTAAPSSTRWTSTSSSCWTASPSPARASTSRPSTTPPTSASFPSVASRCHSTARSPTAADVIGFNDIFNHLSQLKLAVYAPLSYILPSRLKKYEALYDTQVEGGGGKLKQATAKKPASADDHQPAQAPGKLGRILPPDAQELLQKSHRDAGEDRHLQETGAASVCRLSPRLCRPEPDFDDDEFPCPATPPSARKSRSTWKTWTCRPGSTTCKLTCSSSKLLAEMAKVTPSDDAKLQHLKTQITSKLTSPINPGNRKVLIFTAFADTANYLYDNLAKHLLHHHKVHCAKVTGSDSAQIHLHYSGQPPELRLPGLLTLFSPRSKEKAVIYPNEPREIDILIGTDCISEGQNLQDCDYVINYDIHWNPVRIIQRFGRVDRIGSQNASIQLVNYWPDISLDEYINLKERVENRMMIADVTATGDDNVLNAQANDVAYRKEQLRRLQDEVIEMEDLKTGVSITDLGLNDFRMDLLNYIKDNGELSHVPNGMHAVVPAQPEQACCPA